MPFEFMHSLDEKAQLALVSQALALIRESDKFRRTRRLASFLEHLVMKVALGRESDLSEQTIATEFFRRDPNTYNPSDDPIVRVHTGRLRVRLAAYYGGEGKDAMIRIALPPGRYRPTVQFLNPSASAERRRMVLLPAHIYAAQEHKRFAALGMVEELKHQLYERFGDALIQPFARRRCWKSSQAVDELNHLLVDSSIRIDRDCMRIGVRLVQSEDVAIVWSRQFDQSASGNIPEQQRTATTIANALHDYLNTRRTLPLQG